MALTPIPKTDDSPAIAEGDAHYPYGTELHFDDDTLEALGIDLKAGQKMEIKAEGFVERRTDEAEEGEEPETHLCIQLTAIDVQAKGPDRVSALYGDG